ncbi:sensor histidine kinase [Streptomyces violascens]|uniref:sensor histidine kinase n=1 Tax=Streptomyces violascens TaxID=67381 RepID=UPI00364B6577
MKRLAALSRLGERARLTLLYGALLIVSGTLLVGLVYVLVQQGLSSTISEVISTKNPVPATKHPGSSPQPTPATGLPVDPTLLRVSRTMSQEAAGAVLHRLLAGSSLALVLFAVVSLALAWWMTGRVLRPVGVITTTARHLAHDDLGGRIALEAPPGELKQLADTFDELLGRIEQLVSAQKRFVANAAHELRTPLAVQRAAAQIGLADPTPEKVARVRSKLMALSKYGEHLIDGLLLLSATDRGLERREAVALDEVATATADELTSLTRELKVSMVRDIHPLRVEGDAVLLKHLVHNLLNNAIRYNEPGGRVALVVAAGILEVSNSGPRVPQDVVPRLFEPFRRAHERTSAPGEGAGLGLSIVKSIAAAHGAKVTARANPEGGLTVQVRFPGRSTPDPHEPAVTG